MSDQPPIPVIAGASADPSTRRPAASLWWAVALLAGALAIAALALAWRAEQRGTGLEQELVRRQQDSAAKVAEAGALARQAQENSADAAAKVALLEARVAEVSVQRSQLEDLVQSLSRSRDDSLLADIESAVRVAQQQTAITGSAEPLVAVLKQSDERLARYDQPRVEGVRRAMQRDLDRIKATSVADIGTLVIRLDETIRMIDELPLLALGELGPSAEASGAARAPRSPASAPPPASPASAAARWRAEFARAWEGFSGNVWGEVKSLVRVTRIDHPEAMLLAPDQAFFVRENLKLRLLNARLALLSRQFDTAQADLQAAQTTLDRYFDRQSKRTQLAIELLRQVAGQARQVVVPRPDDTLAALAAASAAR